MFINKLFDYLLNIRRFWLSMRIFYKAFFSYAFNIANNSVSTHFCYRYNYVILHSEYGINIQLYTIMATIELWWLLMLLPILFVPAGIIEWKLLDTYIISSATACLAAIWNSIKPDKTQYTQIQTSNGLQRIIADRVKTFWFNNEFSSKEFDLFNDFS